tara:strand:+ start:11082 stop:11681 length:600 start_codon:yes stop_codon:yes gene_type:complete
MEDVFTNIYENNEWGDNKNKEYSGSSGHGSSKEYNKKYIETLKNIIKDYKIKNIVDLGCGDFRIGRLIYDDLNISYTGYDTYKKIIDYNITQYPKLKYTFKHLDFYTNKESIIEGDMCILKDVLQHWSTNEIYVFLDYLTQSKKFKYILLVNCCGQETDNSDINTGGFRWLSFNYLPLKKYNPVKIGNYQTKQISIIGC